MHLFLYETQWGFQCRAAERSGRRSVHEGGGAVRGGHPPLLPPNQKKTRWEMETHKCFGFCVGTT